MIDANAGKRRHQLVRAALIVATLFVLGWPALASGQGRDPSAPGSAPCSPSAAPGAPGTPPADSTEGQARAQPPENLSERLARSDGVICPPPQVDPEIKLPTPETGNTPVIPPPGSPGGDPTVRPK